MLKNHGCKPGVHRFYNYIAATSKFYVPEGDVPY